jgi:hypothetical protein
MKIYTHQTLPAATNLKGLVDHSVEVFQSMFLLTPCTEVFSITSWNWTGALCFLELVQLMFVNKWCPQLVLRIACCLISIALLKQSCYGFYTGSLWAYSNSYCNPTPKTCMSRYLCKKVGNVEVLHRLTLAYKLLSYRGFSFQLMKNNFYVRWAHKIL